MMRDKIRRVARGALPATKSADQHADDVAAAPIAALPDMIEPLVWEDNGSDGLEASGYSITEGQKGNLVWWPPYGDGIVSRSEKEAKDAADRHHRAAIMAAFGVAQ